MGACWLAGRPGAPSTASRVLWGLLCAAAAALAAHGVGGVPRGQHAEPGPGGHRAVPLQLVEGAHVPVTCPTCTDGGMQARAGGGCAGCTSHVMLYMMYACHRVRGALHSSSQPQQHSVCSRLGCQPAQGELPHGDTQLCPGSSFVTVTMELHSLPGTRLSR